VEHDFSNFTGQIAGAFRTTWSLLHKFELSQIIASGTHKRKPTLLNYTYSSGQKLIRTTGTSADSQYVTTYSITYRLSLLLCVRLHTIPCRGSESEDFHGALLLRPQSNLERYQDKAVRGAWLTGSPPAREV